MRPFPLDLHLPVVKQCLAPDSKAHLDLLWDYTTLDWVPQRRTCVPLNTAAAETKGSSDRIKDS